MGAILNGLAAHGGILPFGATFLTFSDYLRPSIRLAALMELQVVYVFTHDSIAMGEDGPPIKSVEQVASLRAIPRLVVIRPGDANETSVAWRVAMEMCDRPVGLGSDAAKRCRRSTGRSLPPRTSASRSLHSGRCAPGQTGFDPHRERIRKWADRGPRDRTYRKQKIRVRLVSMPSWELFDAQSQEYRDTVLPPSGSRAACGRGRGDPRLASLCWRSGRRDRGGPFWRFRSGARDDA